MPNPTLLGGLGGFRVPAGGDRLPLALTATARAGVAPSPARLCRVVELVLADALAAIGVDRCTCTYESVRG